MYKYYTDHFWGELDDWEREEEKGFSLIIVLYFSCAMTILPFKKYNLCNFSLVMDIYSYLQL